MYWQKQFQQEDPDLALKAIIDAIREDHPNYGYRRILAVLRNRGIVVNKKKLQRIIQKFKLQVRSYARKSRKYSSYRGVKGHIEKNLFTDGSPAPSLIKKSQPIRQNSSTTN